MIAAEPTNTSLEQQINTLQSEISARKTDIQNLQEAFDALTTGKPRPINPSADNAFEMLKELVGGVPKSLEQQHIYQVKLAETQRALELAIIACKEKEVHLKNLQQQRRELQAGELFEEVKLKGEKFNNCVIELLQLFSEIKETSNQISTLRGDSCLRIIGFEKREIPWFRSSAQTIAFLRKFEVNP